MAVIGPLADSKADTEGSWMVFGHVPAAVTVLEGITGPAAERAASTHAPGPQIRRDVPSFFEDLIPGLKNTRTDEGGRPRPRSSRRSRRRAAPTS